MIKKFLGILFLILVIGGVFAFNINEDNNKFKLKTKFQIKEDKIKLFSLDLETNGLFLVQFKGILTKEKKEYYENNGISFIDYIPDNSYLIDGEISVLENDDLFYKSFKYKDEYKIAENLLDETSNFKVNILVIDDSQVIASYFANQGFEVLDITKNKIQININDINDLYIIASHKKVKWIEKKAEFIVQNDIARNIMNVTYVWEDLGYYGEGQIIAIADTGLDTGVNDASMHDDFEGRILNIIDLGGDGANDDNGHGTHVAGSVLGNGIMSGSNPITHNYNNSFAGVAPESQLYFQSIDNAGALSGIPGDLNDLFSPAKIAGARIHSNSWGSDCNGDYSSNSVEVDEFIWSNPDMSILFSAGNYGTDDNSDGLVDLDSLGCPATSKNVITIGASENVRAIGCITWGGVAWPSSIFAAEPIFSDSACDNYMGIAGFSSRGPTDDGRIKPDLVAPGTYILSTKSSNSASTGWGTFDANYLYNGGTSMSNPLAAGAAALVREYYIKNQSVLNPTAALIKATLINGAKDISPGQYGTGATQEITRRADTSMGWGLIDVKNSISPIEPKVIEFMESPINLVNGETYIKNFEVLDNLSGIPLRITLVWTDYPSTIIAGTNLVNDLDLNLTMPNGTVLYGNDFDNNQIYDRLNNVEGIDVIFPENGNYTINIYGYNIPQGPQDFTLVISYPYNSSLESIPIIPVINKINISSPIALYEYSVGNILVNFSTIHNSSVNISLNGGNLININSTDNLSFNYILENLSIGNYLLEIFVNSLDDNSNISTNLSFNINNTKLISNYPTNNLTLNETDLNINLTLNFSRPISELILNYENTTYNLTNNLNGNFYNSSFTLNHFKENNLTFNFTDFYNYSSSFNLSFFIRDVNPLTIDILSPINNSSMNSSSLGGINFIMNFSKNLVSLNYSLNTSNITRDIFYLVSNKTIDGDLDIDEFGANTFLFEAVDEYGLYKNLSFNIQIDFSLCANGNDTDCDGINDSVDFLFGNESNMNTNYANLDLFIDGDNNLSRIFNSTSTLIFKDGLNEILEFNYDFSQNTTLNLSNIILKTEPTIDASVVFTKGINLNGGSKNIYLELLGDTSSNGALCVKDEIVNDFSEISVDCSGANEVYVDSLSFSNSDFSVTSVGGNFVKIAGLEHSGIRQVCLEDWSISDWDDCLGNTQFRTVTDDNNCGTVFNKPSTSQSCTEDEASSSSGGSSVSTNDDEYFSETNIETTKSKIYEPSSFSYDILVNGIENSNDEFEGEKNIKIKNNAGITLVEFDYDFDDGSLDIEDLEIIEIKDSNNNGVIVKGLEGYTKRIKFERILKSNKICVADKKINTINDITNDCSGTFEKILVCDGSYYDKYRCRIEGTHYAIDGLSHSGAIEISNEIEETEEIIELHDNNLELTAKSNIEKTTEEEIINTEEKSFNILYLVLSIIGIIILIITIIGIIYLKGIKEKLSYIEEFIMNNPTLTKDQIKSNLLETGFDEWIIDDILNRDFDEESLNNDIKKENKIVSDEIKEESKEEKFD